jgi:hypothetical protein
MDYCIKHNDILRANKSLTINIPSLRPFANSECSQDFCPEKRRYLFLANQHLSTCARTGCSGKHCD